MSYYVHMRTRRNIATSKTMTLRLDSATLERLDVLAATTDRSKAWLAAQAVREFLETNEWQTRAIDSAVKRANSRGARFVEHEKVAEWLSSWGTAKERKPPL
jgi:RHH-type transcriptional regulator, rel operon repressor / antitoxin RelB